MQNSRQSVQETLSDRFQFTLQFYTSCFNGDELWICFSDLFKLIWPSKFITKHDSRRVTQEAFKSSHFFSHKAIDGSGKIMSTYREILNFQLGNYSNYVSTHWWNIQVLPFCIRKAIITEQITWNELLQKCTWSRVQVWLILTFILKNKQCPRMKMFACISFWVLKTNIITYFFDVTSITIYWFVDLQIHCTRIPIFYCFQVLIFNNKKLMFK